MESTHSENSDDIKPVKGAESASADTTESTAKTAAQTINPKGRARKTARTTRTPKPRNQRVSTKAQSASDTTSPSEKPAEKPTEKSSTSIEAPEVALRVEGVSIPECLLQRATLFGNSAAYRFKQQGEFVTLNWNQALDQVASCASALGELGVAAGDRVAIFSNTRVEWTLADLAILGLGAVTVPIYPSSSDEDLLYVIRHAEPKFIFVETDKVRAKVEQTFAQLASDLPRPTLIQFEKSATLKDWESISQDRSESCREQYRKSVASVLGTDLATIVYTSGTTGQPKGVMLNHHALISEIRAVAKLLKSHQGDRSLLFLPLAHVLGRMESFIAPYAGLCIAFAESIGTINSNLREIKPTYLICVPRILEKFYAKIQSEVRGLTDYQKRLFQWAIAVGNEVAQVRSQGRAPSIKLRLKHAAADTLVLRKLRESFGGSLQLAISGGAPLSRELCEFFHACGVPVYEGYGLTETFSALAVNRPDSFRFGTVGKPLTGINVRIAADGEIEIKGQTLFQGYYKDSAATEAVMTPDGWFCTGDIGEIDDGGFIRITDRKKDLIITSGGKNVAPGRIENLLKQSPWISQAAVFGDRQKYLVALVTLNETSVRQWAKENGIAHETLGELAKEAKVRKLIKTEFDRVNSHLASYESIKNFELLDRDFSVEGGELTPSLKLKRSACYRKHAPIVDSMYGV